jgi:IMP dehydrogenase/GMP reductase
MRIKTDEGLTFDDLLLEPQYSEVRSRADVDYSIELTKGIKLKFPIIPANMKTVTHSNMAREICRLGGMAILHRFMPIEEQLEIFNDLKMFKGENDPCLHVGFSIGIKDADKENLKKIIEVGCKIICIDVAHGDSVQCIEMTKYVSETYPDVFLISGNVATHGGAMNLWEAGADVVKVGIGNGCFAAGTRVLMANGFYKNIENIEPGDKVINKNGKPVKVTNAFCTGTKKVSKLKTNLFYEDTYVTPDHNYWVGDLNSVSYESLQSGGYVKHLDKLSKTKPKQSKYKWKAINDIKQDILLLPNKISFELPISFEIPLMKRNGGFSKYTYEQDYSLTPSYELGYILGTFLGDGHAACAEYNGSHVGSVRWYFGKDEQDIVDKLTNCLVAIFNKSNPVIKNQESTIDVVLYYKPFADFLYSFNKKENKHLPENLLVDNEKYLTGLYDGLLDSYGHYDKDGRKTLGNTSKYIIELFNVINLILTGIMPNNSKCLPTAGGLENCNVDNCNIPYKTQILKRGDYRLTKDYQVAKILGYENSNLEVPVYDITVDCDTHSFIANNAIVHNSICTTRIETGNGVPLLTSLVDTAEAKFRFETEHNRKVFIMSDGGCKAAGDLVKALCFADLCMVGNMFAGAEETPGNTLQIDGQTYKEYVGSSTHRGNRTEGVAALVHSKSRVEKIIQKMIEGIQSGCSYQGAFNLKELKEKAVFIKMTSSGLRESHVHDVILRK